MAAWGLIRFVCQSCGERFWCRVSDQYLVNPRLAICHDCAHPLAPELPTLASQPENVQTTGHRP